MWVKSWHLAVWYVEDMQQQDKLVQAAVEDFNSVWIQTQVAKKVKMFIEREKAFEEFFKYVRE